MRSFYYSQKIVASKRPKSNGNQVAKTQYQDNGPPLVAVENLMVKKEELSEDVENLSIIQRPDSFEPIQAQRMPEKILGIANMNSESFFMLKWSDSYVQQTWYEIILFVFFNFIFIYSLIFY